MVEHIEELKPHFEPCALREAGILAEGQEPATVNRRTTLLGQAFRLGIRRRRISSLPEIPKLRENNVRRGFFEKPEFEAVVKHLPEYLRGFVEFGYLVGWRKSDVASLEWADVAPLRSWNLAAR